MGVYVVGRVVVAFMEVVTVVLFILFYPNKKER